MSTARNISNILVTGGAGFIGSAFIRYLLRPQTHFAGTCLNLDALTYAGNLANLAEVENDPRYKFEQGDICNQAFVERLCYEYAIDTIIHFAAESHVDRSIQGPAAFIQTNIIGTFHLLEAVRRFPHIHFHHVSTDEVFGSLGTEGFFTEKSPYSPRSPYSASKAASDHLVNAYHHTYGLSTTLSNCSNNYGPYHYPEKLIPLMILNCLKRQPLPVYGTGDNIRDWLFVEDHAEALLLILKQGRSGETYNVGGNNERRNIELVHELIDILSVMQEVKREELERLITFVADRPGHDWRYAIDSTKLRTELGWEPKHRLQDGLRKTVEWYVHNTDWISGIEDCAISRSTRKAG